jgi:hypothetical protein
MLSQVKSGYIRLCQFISGRYILGQVMAVYVMLGQVGSRLVRLVQDRSGYFMLVQVKWE